MKWFALSAAMALSMVQGAGAQAMTANTTVAGADVVAIADTCGVGRHRGLLRRCVPNHVASVNRKCGPGTHPGYAGQCVR